MKRRTLLSSAAAITGAALVPKTAKAGSYQADFEAAQTHTPWLSAYKTIDRKEFSSSATVTGKWPEGLQGTLYRNGPARHEIGEFRYQHWFDGDGLVHAYKMSSAGVSHKAKLVQTYKLEAEEHAGRALYPGFATVPPNPAPVTSPDAVNSANISVLHHHGKLLALWEAGSPWEMDENSLDTRGVYAFSDHTRGVPFSAHPRVEADGTLWNFGYLSGGKIFVLWHIDANGALKNIGKIPADPITMVHDFIVTSRHIVMLVPPFHYEPERASSFLDAHRWADADPTRVLVVDKNDFSKYFWVELPSQWVFHFGNGWEDKNGVIHFDAARADNPMAMINTFRDIMRGEITSGVPSHHHTYRLDTKAKKISEAPMFGPGLDSEFPCIDPRVSCVRNERLFFLSSSKPATHFNLNEVSAYSYKTERLDTYRYPDREIPEEHLFVARPGSAPEKDGWIVGTTHDWAEGIQRLNVFDANAVSAGPVASAKLPYGMPLGLHGKFVHG